MQLETQHLLLKNPEDCDLPFLVQNLWSDAKIMDWLLWKPIDSVDEAKEYVKRIMSHQDFWLIFEKSSDEVIGFCGFGKVKDDVYEDRGLAIARSYQGKGYGKEALEAMLNLVFYQRKARKFLYHCLSNNIPSKKLVQHFGFYYQSSHEEDFEEKNVRIDTFTIYKEEYIAWLGKQGKTIRLEKIASLRLMLLLVAVVGMILLGIDLIQKKETILTAFYAYFTGIGVAGAIACSWVLAKRNVGDSDV